MNQQRLAHVFDQPVTNLGEFDVRFDGVFTPTQDVNKKRIGVTEQFLENAATYHERYSDLAYWDMLIDAAISRASLDHDVEIILDIGSGSGNSVIPLLKRYPKAFVVATDISPQLLAILRDYCLANGYADRVAFLCVDASDVSYRSGVADLVVGAAILHHILEPERVIESAHGVLKPGGIAIFFEPCRPLSTVLLVAYKQIQRVALTQSKALADPSRFRGLKVIDVIANDIAVRTKPLSHDELARLDDKWMFSKTYFEGVANKMNWETPLVFPLQNSSTPVRLQTTAYLRLAAELSEGDLPPWSWQIIDEFDAILDDEVKRSAIGESGVIFKKPHQAGAQSHAVASHYKWWWAPADSGTGLFADVSDPSARLYWFGYRADGEGCLYVLNPVQRVLERRGPQGGAVDETFPLTAFSISPEKIAIEVARRAWHFVSFTNTGRSAVAFGEFSDVWLADHNRVACIEADEFGCYVALTHSNKTLTGRLVKGADGRLVGDFDCFYGGPSPAQPTRGHSKHSAPVSVALSKVDDNTILLKVDGAYCVFERAHTGANA